MLSERRARPDASADALEFTPQADIDRSALQSNLKRVRATAPASRVWAVIKANAYGHGVLNTASALCDVDGFAVARVEEGLALRDAGFGQPILILEGPLSTPELQAVAKAGIEICVHHMFQVEMLERTPVVQPVKVWLKVDSGMHRLGFSAQQTPAMFERLVDCRAVNASPALMTHLANADDPADAMTDTQTRQFAQLAKSLPTTPLSVANSAGILGWRQTHLDWVRPGIMLYGISPFVGAEGQGLGLQTVMTLRARLIAVNYCPAGQAVGYGGAYTCSEDQPVGVVGIGYGDGYPRHVGNGTPVLLNGKRVPLIGRVSMDMLTVDLRSQPRAQVGDPVVLWGRDLAVEEIARAAGTIAYELVCGLTTRVRLQETDTATGPVE